MKDFLKAAGYGKDQLYILGDYRDAITGFLGVLGLGAMASCSDPGGQVASDTALPAADSYNGGSSVQEVHLRQQWYSTHLTGAAQLDQLLQTQHGNGR